MNAFEYAVVHNYFDDIVHSLSKDAVILASKVFGNQPANDTIDELMHPTAVCLEDAIFCQELLNCK